MCVRVWLQALLEQGEAGPSGQAPAGEGPDEAGGPAGWREVAHLLASKHDRIDSVQALPLLPLQVTVFAAVLFVTHMTCCLGRHTRLLHQNVYSFPVDWKVTKPHGHLETCSLISDPLLAWLYDLSYLDWLECVVARN